MSDPSHAADDGGLICAFLLDSKGGGKPLDWKQINEWKPGKGALWIHLDYTGPESRKWLAESSGIDEISRAALLAADPRPRSVPMSDGLLLILRGVNLNEGAQPEDMVSIRIFVGSQRVVSLRHRRNNAVRAVRDDLEGHVGPRRVGQFVVQLIDHMLEGVGRVSDQLDDEVSSLEDAVLASEGVELRHQLADLRRRAIALRRHVAPERDVLSRLQNERVGWLTELDRVRLRESADRITRIIEDLDSARERAAVTQEEVANRLSEQMNKRLYVLSVITAIFLPLGLITGLLGVNVGDMPLQHHPMGFAIIGLGTLGLLLLMLLGFRLRKWL